MKNLDVSVLNTKLTVATVKWWNDTKGVDQMNTVKTIIIKIKYLGNERIQWTRSDIDDVFEAHSAFFLLTELIQITATNPILIKRVGDELK